MAIESKRRERRVRKGGNRLPKIKTRVVEWKEVGRTRANRATRTEQRMNINEDLQSAVSRSHGLALTREAGVPMSMSSNRIQVPFNLPYLKPASSRYSWPGTVPAISLAPAQLRAADGKGCTSAEGHLAQSASGDAAAAFRTGIGVRGLHRPPRQPQGFLRTDHTYSGSDARPCATAVAFCIECRASDGVQFDVGGGSDE
ncbi:hypothetical protein B0H17DRAFT_1145323 [Mycena rosella]|uniref:Uncharacterized protein n=1 Tax=Mycena rosella TaxID=1033263 RepID=A0AAD7CQY3_MYCRO|nr:hypothetical protein B0H17DRAFT_1145323 [Mycena rosella]